MADQQSPADPHCAWLDFADLSGFVGAVVVQLGWAKADIFTG